MIPIDKASANFRVVKATVFKFGSQQNHNTGTPAASVTCPFETKLVLPSLTLRVSIELCPRLSENTSPWLPHVYWDYLKCLFLVTLTFSVAVFFHLQLVVCQFCSDLCQTPFRYLDVRVDVTFLFFLGWKRLWAGIWQAPKVSKTRSIIYSRGLHCIAPLKNTYCIMRLFSRQTEPGCFGQYQRANRDPAAIAL